MKGALVAIIAKVEGVVQEMFSRALPHTPTFLAPPIKNHGGTTDPQVLVFEALVFEVLDFEVLDFEVLGLCF